MKEITLGEWISIVQTLVLIVTLWYLIRSTNQQVKSTRQIVTPNLGAEWGVQGHPSKEGILNVLLLLTNYSDFPLYIRDVNLILPKGCPKLDVLKEVHFRPKDTGELAFFETSNEKWSEINKDQDWLIVIKVATSAGSLWEAKFKSIGADNIIFESIREI